MLIEAFHPSRNGRLIRPPTPYRRISMPPHWDESARRHTPSRRLSHLRIPQKEKCPPYAPSQPGENAHLVFCADLPGELPFLLLSCHEERSDNQPSSHSTNCCGYQQSISLPC